MNRRHTDFQDASGRIPQKGGMGNLYSPDLLPCLWAVKQIALPFADPKKQYTRALERCVVDLCRITTLQHVAELTGLGWDTVKAIHQQHLQRTYKAINLKSVR